MEGNRAREGESLPLEPRRSLADLTPELPEEAGLADPGLPHDGHDLPAPRLRLVEALAQQPELGLTADEAGEPLLDVPRGHEPVRAGGRSGHGAGPGQLEAPSQEGRRLSAHHHGARRGRVSQRFQDGPGGTLRVPIDRHVPRDVDRPSPARCEAPGSRPGGRGFSCCPLAATVWIAIAAKAA